MVGVLIALFLTAAAVAFARHETRLMGISTDKLERQQSARAALDLIALDMSMAGLGTGYQSNGTFPGIRIGAFTVNSIATGANVSFNTFGGDVPYNSGMTPGVGSGASIQLWESDAVGGTIGVPYAHVTVDVGVTYADGEYATIAAYERATGQGQICVPLSGTLEMDPTELIVMRTQDMLGAVAARMTLNGGAACTDETCPGGCENVTMVQEPGLFISGPNDGIGPGTNFDSGEIQSDLKTVVWFVRNDPAVPGAGVLRRALFDLNNGCAGPTADFNCGQAVADYVETLQSQVWEWDPTTNTWVNAGQVPITTDRRLRVDLELVTRSRIPSDRPHRAVQLHLRQGNCLPPTSCVALPSSPNFVDRYDRRAYRTSVEVRNSGFMKME